MEQPYVKFYHYNDKRWRQIRTIKTDIHRINFVQENAINRPNSMQYQYEVFNGQGVLLFSIYSFDNCLFD